MPYLKQETRVPLDALLDPLLKAAEANGVAPGEFNYIVTRLAVAAVKGCGKNYATINEIIGALECAKLEFYRRLAAPYEDTKIAENGDVYP